MATLREIEIFYPGSWNDLEFTNDEMIEMVNNSNYCLPFTQPLLSLDHDEVDDVPDVIRRAAFGSLSRFFLQVKDGINHIFCTFSNVPKELAQLIKQHYPRRSIELYPEYEHPITHEIFRNVITGVSFLGAKMPPAVKGMFPDFVLSYQDPPTQGNIITITLTSMEASMPKKKETFQDEPQAASTNPTPTGDAPTITPATNEFSLYIATRRAQLGLTEAEVAERTNSAGDLKVNEQTVKDLEAGIIAPTTLLMDQLAQALELEVGVLNGLMTYPSDASQMGFSEESLRRVIAEELRKIGFQENESLGTYLRRIREEKELSLDDLAIAMEVSSEELAAVEEAELPPDELLEKYAEVLELDLDDLKARRDAMEAANQEQEEESTSEEGTSESAANFQQIVTQMLRPLQREIQVLKSDRNSERDKRKTQEIEHFLEKLETHYHASKAVTGPRIRALLLTSDAVRRQKFAAGYAPQSTREAWMSILEDIARVGNVKVPVGQITNEHGKKTFADDSQEFTARVEAFQQERGIKTYQRAVRLYLRELEG